MRFSKSLKGLTLTALLSTFVLISCNKEDQKNTPEATKASLKVMLIDAPAAYDAVNVDIREIRVHVEDNGNDSGWVSLAGIQPGVYNLLDFRNGLDTVLATGSVPAGTISQIRLILGPDNSVVVNGVSNPLKTPSAQQSGLKLQVHQTLKAGLVYEFWLDFDADKSVVATGSGEYNLKPVIKVFTKKTTGSIEGIISPPAAYPYILAYNAAGDSASTRADSTNGYFLIRGLVPGTYSVQFDPVSPYSSKTATGLQVAAGVISTMGQIVIQ